MPLFLMVTMTIIVIPCQWRSLDTVSEGFCDLTLMKKTWSLRIIPDLVFITRNEMFDWGYIFCSLLGDNRMMVKIFDWIACRACEPSSWAAVGGGLIGVGIMCNISILLPIGIVVAAAAVIIREKGKK